MSNRVEGIVDATLYLGDCRDILPTLSGVDAVVTDLEINKVSDHMDRHHDKQITLRHCGSPSRESWRIYRLCGPDSGWPHSVPQRSGIAFRCGRGGARASDKGAGKDNAHRSRSSAEGYTYARVSLPHQTVWEGRQKDLQCRGCRHIRVGIARQQRDWISCGGRREADDDFPLPAFGGEVSRRIPCRTGGEHSCSKGARTLVYEDRGKTQRRSRVRTSRVRWEKWPSQRVTLSPRLPIRGRALAGIPKGLRPDIACRRIEVAQRQPDLLIPRPAPAEQTAMVMP